MSRRGKKGTKIDLTRFAPSDRIPSGPSGLPDDDRGMRGGPRGFGNSDWRGPGGPGGPSGPPMRAAAPPMSMMSGDARRPRIINSRLKSNAPTTAEGLLERNIDQASSSGGGGGGGNFNEMKDPELEEKAFKTDVMKIVKEMVDTLEKERVKKAAIAIESLGHREFHVSAAVLVIREYLRSDLKADKTALVQLLSQMREGVPMKGKKTTRQMLEGEGAFKAVETITIEVEEGSLTEHKDEFIAFLKDIAKDSKFFDWTKPVPPAFDKFLTENGIDTVVREGGSPTDSGNNQADEVEVQHVDDATVRDAIKKVLDTGKKGTALQEAASGVLSSYPAEQSARQLMRLVLEIAHSNGQIDKDCPWTLEEEYGAVLASQLFEKTAPAKAALFVVQEFAHEKKLERGMLRTIFHNLYDNDCVHPGAFFAWKEDTESNVPGRVQAIIQTNTWFNVLEQVLNEDDEENDEEEEEEESDEDDEFLQARMRQLGMQP